MIYHQNQNGFNPTTLTTSQTQQQQRTIHLINKQGSFISNTPNPTKGLYYRSQSGQSQGQIIFQQGQMNEIYTNNQQQITNKVENKQHQQNQQSANFFGSNSIQNQSNEPNNSLDKFLKIANINNTLLQRSLNGSINQIQQQHHVQINPLSSQSSSNNSSSINHANYTQKNNNNNLTSSSHHNLNMNQQQQQQQQQFTTYLRKVSTVTGGVENNSQQQSQQNEISQMKQIPSNQQLQTINRQASVQIVSSGSLYIPSKSNNSQGINSTHNFSGNVQQENKNIIHKIDEKYQKNHSNSSHEQYDKIIQNNTNSPLRISSIVGNTASGSGQIIERSQFQNNNNNIIKNNNYLYSSIDFQNLIQQQQQQQQLQQQQQKQQQPQQYQINSAQKEQQLMRQLSQSNNSLNQQTNNEQNHIIISQNNQNHSQPIQPFIPISSSSPNIHKNIQYIQQQQQQQQQNITNSLVLSNINNNTEINNKQSILLENYKSQPQMMNLNTNYNERESSPYDKLIERKRLQQNNESNSFQIYQLQDNNNNNNNNSYINNTNHNTSFNNNHNTSYNNNMSYSQYNNSNRIDTIKEENILTPRKDTILNISQSQRSDTKNIDTGDTDNIIIRDRLNSQQNIIQEIQSQSSSFSKPQQLQQLQQMQQIQQYNIPKYQSDLPNLSSLSPRMKIQNIKEKKYGNEDLCNYYPVTHILEQDLSKYDLIIKCTLKTQNQSLVNQKIKDFSEGFLFSAI